MNSLESPTPEIYSAVITGTHSSGKSTLLGSFEEGKLTGLGLAHPEYDDFGYGFICRTGTNNPGELIPVITVPEAATWFAAAYKKPELLTTQYDLDIQCNIEALHGGRVSAAQQLAQEVMTKLSERAPTVRSIGSAAVVLSDRGPLDGIVYSALRLGEAPENDFAFNLIGSEGQGTVSRDWFYSTLLKLGTDLVVVSDHSDVPFESSEMRPADVELRESVARAIVNAYRANSNPDTVHVVAGGQEERKLQTVGVINNHINNSPPISTAAA